MDLYQLLLFLHISGAAILFLGLGMEGILINNLKNSSSTGQAVSWVGTLKMLRAAFSLSAILLLLPGIYLALKNWGMTAWIIIGIVLLFLLAGWGSVTGKKLKGILFSLSKDDEPLQNDVKAKLSDPSLVKSFRIKLTLALGIIFIMTLKPDWIGSIVTILAALVIGVLFNLVSPGKNKQIEVP
jgi:hypothetical protein